MLHVMLHFYHTNDNMLCDRLHAGEKHMKKDFLNVLRTVSNDSFREAAYGGLRTMIASDPHFVKFCEKNYRFKTYNDTKEFYLTQHESNMHLIGFIDALIYLCRAGYLDLNSSFTDEICSVDGEDDELDLEYATQLEEKEKQILNAINACIAFIETNDT